MLEYDICFCGNAEKCLLKDSCKRAEKHGPGIYTVSNFYDEKQTHCEFFWAKERKNKNEKFSMGN